jgi:DNA-directed RNA polymerase subunit RPC12/RpoP
MIPPLVRRCPACGHIGPSYQFRGHRANGGSVVTCPACRHRFEVVDDPRLN